MKCLFLVLMLFLAGCTDQIDDEEILPGDDVDSGEVNADEFMKEKAINLCVKKCKESSGDLSSGPCLDGDIINDWACDVAHFPREYVDNLPENQCNSYREPVSSNFVEISTDCGVIKTG